MAALDESILLRHNFETFMDLGNANKFSGIGATCQIEVFNMSFKVDVSAVIYSLMAGSDAARESCAFEFKMAALSEIVLNSIYS